MSKNNDMDKDNDKATQDQTRRHKTTQIKARKDGKKQGNARQEATQEQE
jgi:hypothetical protein